MILYLFAGKQGRKTWTVKSDVFISIFWLYWSQPRLEEEMNKNINQPSTNGFYWLSKFYWIISDLKTPCKKTVQEYQNLDLILNNQQHQYMQLNYITAVLHHCVFLADFFVVISDISVLLKPESQQVKIQHLVMRLLQNIWQLLGLNHSFTGWSV